MGSLRRVVYSAPPPCANFATAAEAWFWTVRALRARHEGARGSGAGVKRPCEPDDVIACVDALYRTRRISLDHARVLGRWGERQRQPDRFEASAEECAAWREALDLLAGRLRAKGILE